MTGFRLALLPILLPVFLGIFLAVSPTKAQQPAEIVVYSTRYQEEDRQVFERFTTETGIAVRLVELDVDPLIDGKGASNPDGPADVVISTGAATLWHCANEGLLRPFRSPQISFAVPAQFRDPGEQWVGLSKWARVIIYRKDEVDPAELKTYEDLADPQWQGRLMVRSSSSLYNQALVASMIAANGIERTDAWAKGLVANFARVPQGGDGTQIRGLAAGEGDIALSNTRYFARFASSEKLTEREVIDGLGVIFPNQEGRGTLVDIVGAGIGRQARNPQGGQRLIEFILRPDIQAVFAGGNLEYPIRTDVPPAPELQKLGSFKIDPANVGQLGRFGPEAVQIMTRAEWQ
ncbi:MAG TPA: extracellular solute-binding protein [Stellaceae bacterium]|nr:extracellular solute-binding protein [Stellaceae bacterium]